MLFESKKLAQHVSIVLLYVCVCLYVRFREKEWERDREKEADTEFMRACLCAWAHVHSWDSRDFWCSVWLWWGFLVHLWSTLVTFGELYNFGKLLWTVHMLWMHNICELLWNYVIARFCALYDSCELLWNEHLLWTLQLLWTWKLCKLFSQGMKERFLICTKHAKVPHKLTFGKWISMTPHTAHCIQSCCGTNSCLFRKWGEAWCSHLQAFGEISPRALSLKVRKHLVLRISDLWRDCQASSGLVLLFIPLVQLSCWLLLVDLVL